jgi:hypothetical protein
MKKILSTLFVLIALTMMAGGAWASTLDIAAAGAVAADTDVDAAATGAYVVGSEWLAGQAGVVNVDLGAAIPSPGVAAADRSGILYTPTINIGNQNTITITAVNGAIAPNVNYGLWDLAAVAAKVASLVDFVADVNGNYTSMTFKFDTSDLVKYPTGFMPAGSVCVLTETGLAPAAANRPELRFTNAQLTAGNMTLQVTGAKDGTGVDLVAPLTVAETVAKRVAQLSAKVQYLTGAATYADGNATSVINVEATPISRSKFIVEALQDTPTTTTSTFAVLAASATVNQGINLATASYNMTFVGDQTAIVVTTGVKLAGTNFIRGSGQWTIASTFAAHDLRVPGANDVLITVDGSTIINTDTYKVTLVITPSEVGVAAKTVLDQAIADVWIVNAMQARIPYLLVDTRTTGNSGYASFFELTNRSSQTARVSIDAIISNEDSTINVTESKTDALILEANSVTIIRQADLDAYFSLIDNTKLYRVALVLTVVAPQNSVDVTAWHIGPTTRTSAAVLYNTNNAADGRLWQ